MNFLLRFVRCLPMIVAAASAGGALAAESRPNIVLILCDDLGFSDVGCYGGEIRTPNIDRLADQGLRFTQFYNCAVCVTTRRALLSGLHPRNDVMGRIGSNMVTIAEVLRSAGYQTSLTGKWHVGSKPPLRPIDRGFDEFYGLADGCCNYFDPAQPDPKFYHGGRTRNFLHNGQPVTQFPDDYYTTDAFTSHAVRMIHRYAADDRPFFVHLCYTAPHFPLHAKPSDIDRYRGKHQNCSSMIVAPDGRIHAQAALKREELLVADLDIDLATQAMFKFDTDGCAQVLFSDTVGREEYAVAAR